MVNPLDIVAPNDKQLHFAYTYILAHLLSIVFSWIGVLVCIIITSLIKEWLDMTKGGYFDYKDILANLLGYIAFIIIYLACKIS